MKSSSYDRMVELLAEDAIRYAKQYDMPIRQAMTEILEGPIPEDMFESACEQAMEWRTEAEEARHAEMPD